MKRLYIVMWTEPRRRHPMMHAFPTKSDAGRFAAAIEQHPELPRGVKVETFTVPFWHNGFPPKRGGTRAPKKRKTSRKKK